MPSSPYKPNQFAWLTLVAFVYVFIALGVISTQHSAWLVAVIVTLHFLVMTSGLSAIAYQNYQNKGDWQFSISSIFALSATVAAYVSLIRLAVPVRWENLTIVGWFGSFLLFTFVGYLLIHTLAETATSLIWGIVAIRRSLKG